MNLDARNYRPAILDDRFRDPVALALGLVAAFAAAKLLLHLLAVCFTPYEIHRDEFLYLAMGEHLRFWKMDFPPAIAVLANIARGMLGDNLFAVRLFPALAGTALVVVAGLTAREWGGGRFAQALAMLCTLCPPLFLRSASLFQPVVFDQLCWTVGLYALTRLATDPQTRWWLLLGCTAGFGLLTKFSILFFAASAFLALLVCGHRKLLLSRGPWLALALALLIGSPTIIGQIRLDFPVLIHMGDLQRYQLQRVTYSEFLLGQLLMLGPAAFVALIGLVYLLVSAEMRPWRVVGVTCLLAFLLLMFLHGKPYYIGPIYPVLFAAGAVFLNQLPQKYRRPVMGGAMVLVFAGGVLTLPFGLPVVPPGAMAKYAAAIGIKQAVTTNRGTVLPLPQDYADMLGWEEQVKTAARVFAALPREKQRAVWLVAANYGEAGALEFYGPRHGLPRRIMLPQNFLLWPAAASARTILTVGISRQAVEHFFEQVTILGQFEHVWMVEEERQFELCLGEKPVRDLREAWLNSATSRK